MYQPSPLTKKTKDNYVCFVKKARLSLRRFAKTANDMETQEIYKHYSRIKKSDEKNEELRAYTPFFPFFLAPTPNGDEFSMSALFRVRAHSASQCSRKPQACCSHRIIIISTYKSHTYQIVGFGANSRLFDDAGWQL